MKTPAPRSSRTWVADQRAGNPAEVFTVRIVRRTSQQHVNHPSPPRNYKPSDRLASLFRACEKACAKECCGIGAFDFSPLFVASHLAIYSGVVSESDVSDWLREIDKFEAETSALPANELGLICMIDDLADSFCSDDVRVLAAQLRHSVRIAPQICRLSTQLASPVSVWETHQANRNRINGALERQSQTPSGTLP
jgi:hypothetical protein